MTEANTGAASTAKDPPARYDRGEVEFGRSISYVDATFAIATTLLVTTLNPSDMDWSNWSTFSSSEAQPLAAFALSFVVITAFWWGHHRLVASLGTLNPRFVFASIAMLAFIVLVPFTTEALGQYSGDEGVVSTVAYATNIAAVSIVYISLSLIAYRDQLFATPMTARALRIRLLQMCDTPIVFLASIPLALWVSAGSARIFWALLIVTGNTIGRITPRVGT